MPGTGKNYLQFWLKEYGLRMESIKLVEAHATKATHLSEILQLLFPNGFFERRAARKELEQALNQFHKYSGHDITQDELELLIETVSDDHPVEAIETIERFEDDESNAKLRQVLRSARSQLAEVADRLEQIQAYMADNDAMPTRFQNVFADGPNNYSFSVKVFTPISFDMPSEPVPDFFEPYAIPVDDFKKHSLDWSLKIVHGSKHERYNEIYNSIVSVGETSFADLKNLDEISGREYVEEKQYGESQTVETTRVEPESQSLDAFKRDWTYTFAADGVVCGSQFEHRLRPKLKDALLSDEPDVIVLYTGFLKSKSLRKTVMTHFLETYRSIIENLSGDDLQQLDRKFIVSMIEAQEALKRGGSHRQLNKEDRYFNRFIREAMNDSRHFNTDFWFDFKPDEAHPMVLAKSNHRIVTRMEVEDLQNHFSRWDSEVKDRLYQAFQNPDYMTLDKFGYGFALLTEGNVPKWTRNGRTTFGHRLPCPRMTASTPIDEVGGDDFSFFVDELGYGAAGETINFEDYQEQLFGEEWDKTERPYIEKKDERKEKEREAEKEQELTEQESKKRTACGLLKAEVKQNGVPDSWSKCVEEEVKPELIEMGLISKSFGIKQLMNYTKELRDELEAEAEEQAATELDVGQIADELKYEEQFLYGATSKDDKIFRSSR